jgi:hypothetical protein
MKWTRPLETLLEVVVAMWMFDIFFYAPSGPAVGQTRPSQREWARPKL